MLSEKPWTLEAMIRLLLGIFVCVSAAMLLAGLMQSFSGKKLDEQSPSAVVLGTLVLDGSILLMVGWFLWSQRLNWSQAFGFRNRLGYALALGLVGALAFLPVGLILQYLCQLILNSLRVGVREQQAVEMLRKAEPGWLRVYLTLFAAVVAPVAEEMLFRGIIYPAIKQSGFPRAALWGTSLLFALIHLNLANFVPLVVLALMLTWLYERTDNLLASIAAHGTFNAANVIYLFASEHAQHAMR